MRSQLIQHITNSLNHMEETGKVDLGILVDLKELRNLVNMIKTRWLEEPNTDGFYFYQAARNVELIVGRMEDRFQNSQVAHDNPKIAEDSLVLVPLIDDILAIAESSQINEATINKILSETRDLRNTAASTNLIEKLEVDKQFINKDIMKLYFGQLMKNLDIPEQSESGIAES